jgi:hypothetical protein
MGGRLKKIIILILFFLLSLILSGERSALAQFGWEDGTTQGWQGNVYNSTKYYYGGQRSLTVDLNLTGKGFKSAQTVLPVYKGKAGEPLTFRIYVPSTPLIPLDLKAQIYIEDFKGRIIRSRWSFLLADRWNGLSFSIPADFEGPFSLALIFGTEFEYRGKIYVDQTQVPFANLEPKEFYSNNAIPALYNTYVPTPSLSTGFQLVPVAQPGEGLPVRTGGFGTPISSSGEESINESPTSAEETSPAVSYPTTTTTSTTTVSTTGSPVSQSSGGGQVIFEPKTFLLLSIGLFVLSLKLKK